MENEPQIEKTETVELTSREKELIVFALNMRLEEHSSGTNQEIEDLLKKLKS